MRPGHKQYTRVRELKVPTREDAALRFRTGLLCSFPVRFRFSFSFSEPETWPENASMAVSARPREDKFIAQTSKKGETATGLKGHHPRKKEDAA